VERKDKDDEGNEKRGDDFKVILEAFKHIDDLDYIKKSALESKEHYQEEIAAERVDNDKDFLRKLFWNVLSTDEETSVSGEVVKEILKKLDPKEDRKIYEAVIAHPDHSHWSDDMQQYALENINDQKFLIEFVKENEKEDYGNDERDLETLVDAAYKGITDQKWLKTMILEEKVSKSKKEKMIPKVKDTAFLIKFYKAAKAAAEKDPDEDEDDIYDSIDGYVQEISKLIDDQEILKDMAGLKGMWYWDRKYAIEKIDDTKFLLKLLIQEKATDSSKNATKDVTKRLKELGLSEEEINKKATKKATKKKVTKKATKKATKKKKT